jgi:hypothetical protein
VTFRPELFEVVMNQSSPPASDSAFPAVFVVLTTFIGALAWLCAMLGSLNQY